MHLTLAQVAKLFRVTEHTITDWIRQGNLPVHPGRHPLEFNPEALFDWAMTHPTFSAPDTLAALTQLRGQLASLAEALERGGTGLNTLGNDRYEVFRHAVAGLSPDLGLDLARLLDLLTAREQSGGTAIGDRIAIPHPKYPVISPNTPAILRVCYLAEALPMAADNGMAIDTLFILVCPTVCEYERLLGQLGQVINDIELRRVLALRSEHKTLGQALRAAEARTRTPAKVLS